MDNPRLASTVYGIYYGIAGLLYLVLPGAMLDQLDVAEEGAIWVRFAGVLLAVMGYFYLQAGRSGLYPFFGWSVHTRVATAVIFVLLLALGLADSVVLVFAAVDLVGAAWTWNALRE